MEHRNQRRTREQWQTLATEFSASELSQTQFCEQHGLGEKTFHNWRLRLSREAKASSFVPVTTPATEQGCIDRSDAIKVRSGEVMIELPVTVSMIAIGELVCALRNVD